MSSQFPSTEFYLSFYRVANSPRLKLPQIPYFPIIPNFRLRPISIGVSSIFQSFSHKSGSTRSLEPSFMFTKQKSTKLEAYNDRINRLKTA